MTSDELDDLGISIGFGDVSYKTIFSKKTPLQIEIFTAGIFVLRDRVLQRTYYFY